MSGMTYLYEIRDSRTGKAYYDTQLEVITTDSDVLLSFTGTYHNENVVLDLSGISALIDVLKGVEQVLLEREANGR